MRAYRPTADRVVARIWRRAADVELKAAGDGLFEGIVENANLPLRYELEVAYPDGNTFTMRDPYSFAPTLGELDLHLAGEGRHEEIYQRLGAHVTEIDGAAGTAFAVWAPSAASVSVVGEFNSWDGRLHPMRSLGASGIWELFVPGVEPGARYKYEIRTQDGELRMKADPYAFRAEHPPRTDSVVHRPEHEWRDEAWLAERARRSRTASRSRSTRSISARGAAAPTTRTRHWATGSWASSSRATRPTWASRTWSCCP